jgi:hypothetical protein
MMRCEIEGYGATVRVTEDYGFAQINGFQKAANVLGGRPKARIDVVAALRLASSGEVKRDDVQIRVKLFDQRNECLRTAHEPVKKDERRPILCRSSLFEVRETKAIHTNLTTLNHDKWNQGRIGAGLGGPDISDAEVVASAAYC